jgi:hypothetical protein
MRLTLRSRIGEPLIGIGKSKDTLVRQKAVVGRKLGVGKPEIPGTVRLNSDQPEKLLQLLVSIASKECKFDLFGVRLPEQARQNVEFDATRKRAADHYPM